MSRQTSVTRHLELFHALEVKSDSDIQRQILRFSVFEIQNCPCCHFEEDEFVFGDFDELDRIKSTCFKRTSSNHKVNLDTLNIEYQQRFVDSTDCSSSGSTSNRSQHRLLAQREFGHLPVNTGAIIEPHAAASQPLAD